jgi:large subunit ribosomal protein L35
MAGKPKGMPICRLNQLKGLKMPKLKTKSGAKKRFKVTATGKILFAKAGRRHGMSKRPQSMLRDSRGMHVMNASDVARVKRHMLPYA